MLIVNPVIQAINLLRRRLRDGDLHTYAVESQFYAEALGIDLDDLRCFACRSLDPILR